MRDNNDLENIRYVIKIRSRGAGKIAAIKEAIERGILWYAAGVNHGAGLKRAARTTFALAARR